MLPKIQSLAEQRGVTVDCKLSTELMNNEAWHSYMELTNEYKDIKATELKFPGQYEMTCTDAFGKVLSRETSFSLPVFEAWILSDRCSPDIINSECYQPGEFDFSWEVPSENPLTTDIWILEVNWDKFVHSWNVESFFKNFFYQSSSRKKYLYAINPYLEVGIKCDSINNGTGYQIFSDWTSFWNKAEYSLYCADKNGNILSSARGKYYDTINDWIQNDVLLQGACEDINEPTTTSTPTSTTTEYKPPSCDYLKAED